MWATLGQLTTLEDPTDHAKAFGRTPEVSLSPKQARQGEAGRVI